MALNGRAEFDRRSDFMSTLNATCSQCGGAAAGYRIFCSNCGAVLRTPVPLLASDFPDSPVGMSTLKRATIVVIKRIGAIAEPVKPLRASAIIAAVLYVIDAFVLSQGFLALVLAALVLLYFLPATLWALLTNRRVARWRAAKAGIYLLAAVSIVFTIGSQNRMADRRIVKLGDACLAYRAKYHRYPKELEALVPEFMSSVPVARYELPENERFFYYAYDDDREPMLYYVALPPFGRRFYYMRSGCWGYLD